MSKHDEQQVFLLSSLIVAFTVIPTLGSKMNRVLEVLLHNTIYVCAKELDPAAMRRIAFESARSVKSGRDAVEEALSMLSSDRWETAIKWVENAKALDDDQLWLATSPVLFL